MNRKVWELYLWLGPKGLSGFLRKRSAVAYVNKMLLCFEIVCSGLSPSMASSINGKNILWTRNMAACVLARHWKLPLTQSRLLSILFMVSWFPSVWGFCLVFCCCFFCYFLRIFNVVSETECIFCVTPKSFKLELNIVSNITSTHAPGTWMEFSSTSRFGTANIATILTKCSLKTFCFPGPPGWMRKGFTWRRHRRF